MADNETVLRAHRSWRGAPMAIATVISAWGSAPRPRGSHMLVHQDGRIEGSVSGGCVEGDVIEAAAGVIVDGAPLRRRYGVTDDRAWSVGLPCGGTIEVLLQRVGEGGFAPALFDAIDAARARGATLAVSTDLGTGRSRPGAEAASDVVFVNRYPPPRRLLIVGAVQIAQSLARIAQPLDIETTVIDPRTRFLTAERFPGVTLDPGWPDEVIAARTPDAATAIVTLSHDPKIDDPGLRAALASPAGYIAALGSRRSHAARRQRLADCGLSTVDLDRIEAPAGIDIGAIGAAEIALSIAAGMVAALGRSTA